MGLRALWAFYVTVGPCRFLWDFIVLICIIISENVCHRAERALAEADYDEETACDNYYSPPFGQRTGPPGQPNA